MNSSQQHILGASLYNIGVINNLQMRNVSIIVWKGFIIFLYIVVDAWEKNKDFSEEKPQKNKKGN